jgi:hypothetical protein
MAFILNETDIQFSAGRHVPGAEILLRFVDMVNQNSDGWPHWAAAANASTSLQRIVKEGNGTPESIRKALGPMRSFCTRKGLPMDWAS